MSDTATKADLRVLEDEIHAVRTELKDEIRAVAITVERLDAKVDAVIEGLSSTRDEMRREMASMEERLVGRMSVIERVVGGHTLDLQGLTVDTRRTYEEILALRVDMTNGFARNDTDHAALEARMKALEEKLAIEKT